MKLTVKNDDNDGIKDIFMELSLDQFYAFLSQMEKCKAYLDMLSNKSSSDEEEDEEEEGEATTTGADEESSAAV